nr:hypothetical protein [Acidobacteriota bacterium]
IQANVPAGANVVMEGSHFSLSRTYRESRIPQLRLQTYERYRLDGVDYLIASSQSFGPYLESPRDHQQEYQEYMVLFSQVQELVRFTPGPGRPGPELRILKVPR